MESQKGRLNVQGVASQPGEICNFVRNVGSRSTWSALSAGKHGAIILGRTASFALRAERD